MKLRSRFTDGKVYVFEPHQLGEGAPDDLLVTVFEVPNEESGESSWGYVVAARSAGFKSGGYFELDEADVFNGPDGFRTTLELIKKSDPAAACFFDSFAIETEAIDDGQLTRCWYGTQGTRITLTPVGYRPARFEVHRSAGPIDQRLVATGELDQDRHYLLTERLRSGGTIDSNVVEVIAFELASS